jgi:lipopolysaccharide biosynthesis glycosyltransferase
MWNRVKYAPPLPEPVVVVAASDDNYALPLAVTIRSAIDSLRRGQQLVVNILDGGIRDETKRRLERSWNASNVTIRWLRPPVEKIADLKTENHLNLVTYLRLFMPSLLSPDLSRVIFLDADLLVQRDLTELWQLDLAGAPIAAVHDYFTPYLNTRETIGRASLCDNEPEKCLPVRNYRELGLQGNAGYFNAGVMVVNLAQWRELNVFERAIDLVRRHTEHVLYCDQYALNILFSEKWLPLDARWNQNSNLWGWKGPADCAFDADTFYKLRNDPWIVHFTWTAKPWHYGCTHPAVRGFFRAVDRTNWRGWRPAGPPEFSARMTNAYQQYRAWYRRAVSPVTRSLKATISRKKRAA